MNIAQAIAEVAPDAPVLIAGPTASGKSALALELAARQGGVIVNADAIQVFADWRVLTARPSPEDEAAAKHLLYGHIPGHRPYSVGDWLREVAEILDGPARPIVVGGTGLYFSALTEGLAQIPPTPPDLRAQATAMLEAHGLPALVADLDPATAQRIDLQNPMRVMRAWEVLRGTGRGLADWQDDTPPPLLPRAQTFVLNAPKAWLTPRIERRFDQMLAMGALDEARANLPTWRPDLPSAKAIGARDLIGYLRGEQTLEAAREAATTLTRQFAKRQRTWFRARMSDWHQIDPT